MSASHDEPSFPFVQIRDAYGIEIEPGRVRYLHSAGGFSGARFWRIDRPDAQPLCLRRWPHGQPRPERLRYIHSVLHHARTHGCAFVPAPLRALSGQTWFYQDEHYWELGPWLPGRADFHDHPSPARLAQAMQSLATFHSAVHSFGERGASVAPAPAVRRRAERLRALKTGQLDRIVHHCRAHSDSPLARHAQLFVDGFQTASAGLTEALASACGHTVPILPCIRDTWYDHVLFAGEQVSGIVDFDALRDDTAAGDIARLLGSLVGDDRGRWLAGIEAYQTVRPLTAAETTLCRVLDRANVAMAGLSWLEWIFVDHRQFDDWGEVLKRLDCLATRVKCSRLPSEYLPEPPAPSSGERTG